MASQCQTSSLKSLPRSALSALAHSLLAGPLSPAELATRAHHTLGQDYPWLPTLLASIIDSFATQTRLRHRTLLRFHPALRAVRTLPIAQHLPAPAQSLRARRLPRHHPHPTRPVCRSLPLLLPPDLSPQAHRRSPPPRLPQSPSQGHPTPTPRRHPESRRPRLLPRPLRAYLCRSPRRPTRHPSPRPRQLLPINPEPFADSLAALSPTTSVPSSSKKASRPMHPAQRQHLTGLTINPKPNLARPA